VSPRARVSGPPARFAKAVALSWFAALGFDLFLHGGLLAGFYLEPSSFLLPPRDAFVRIPFGYASFLLLAVLLVGLMERLQIRDWRRGGAFGLLLGGLLWGSSVLGLYSITTASLPMLAGWWIGQTIELGIGGLVAGAALSADRLLPLFLKSLVFVAVAVAVTVVLQSLGITPAIHAR
jgi:hypothetical protein